MKVKFTVADLYALETAYYDLEGTTPANTHHIPTTATSHIIRNLWHRMTKQIQKEEKKNTHD